MNDVRPVVVFDCHMCRRNGHVHRRFSRSGIERHMIDKHSQEIAVKAAHDERRRQRGNERRS